MGCRHSATFGIKAWDIFWGITDVTNERFYGLHIRIFKNFLACSSSGSIRSPWFCCILTEFIHFINATFLSKARGRDSSVRIATRYGLDGTGIESRWVRDFPQPSWPALGPAQPPVQCVVGLFPGGKSGRGVGLATPSPPRAEVHERAELYLYSPSWALRACYWVNLYLYF
jgi:hypothetical protein